MKGEKILEKEEVVGEENKKIEEKDKSLIVNEKTESRKKSKKGLACVICLIILIVLGGSSLVGFGFINKFNDNIISGVTINGVDISGMTKEQATVKIKELADTICNKSVNLKYEDYEISIVAEQVGLNIDVDKIVDEAYMLGRGSNPISNSLETIKTKLQGNEIKINIDVEEEKLEKTISDINGNLSQGVEQPNYYIEEKNLIITKGKSGLAVEKDKVKDMIIEQLTDNKEQATIEIPVKEEEPEKIDIEKIYEDIHKDPQDAYISSNPFEIHAHVDGVDFEQSMEEIKQIISEDKESYQIVLKIIKPNKTTDMLGEEAFPDKLATYSTIYNAGDYNRSNNVELSARKLNNIVLMPGEEFSYNRTLGQRTAESGYKPAPAYVAGKTVYEYGGGICQTSSTLYNAVLLSDLEVTSRTNHCYPAAYVPISRDATVSWGTLDFKFKNNRKNPIKIKSTAGGGTVKIEILGVKEDEDCEVEIESYVASTVGFQTQYEDNPNLEEGKETVIQNGANGSVGVAYKILKKNGEVVSKTLISRDTYSSKPKIISRGTKKVEQKKEEPKKEENTSNKSEENKNSVNNKNQTSTNNNSNKNEPKNTSANKNNTQNKNNVNKTNTNSTNTNKKQN